MKEVLVVCRGGEGRRRGRCYRGNFSRLCVPHNERTPGQILSPIHSKSTLIMTRCNEINSSSFHHDFVHCLMQNWKPFRDGAAEKHYSRLSYSRGPFSVEWKVNKPPLPPFFSPREVKWEKDFPALSNHHHLYLFGSRVGNCVFSEKDSGGYWCESVR